MTRSWDRLLSRPPLDIDWDRLRATLEGRRVLVTGASGSVGTELVALLARSNVGRLTLVDVHEPSLFHQRQRLVRSAPGLSARFVLADVRDRRKMDRVLAQEGPEIVFHLAAYKHVPLAEENLDQVVDVNVFGTLGLAQLAAQAGARSFLFPSTDKAVRPPSIYGATKRVVELALRAMAPECPAMSLRAVRLVNVVGSQGSVVDLFARQLQAGQPLTLTDPTHTRYWISVDEATYLLAQVACADDLPDGVRWAPFLLDAGPAIPMGEFARRVAALLCPEGGAHFQVIGARPGERQHEELAYPFESLVPTAYRGILQAVDSRPLDGVARDGGGPSGAPHRAPHGPARSSGELSEWIERLDVSLRRGDDGELRRSLFELVHQEASWSSS